MKLPQPVRTIGKRVVQAIPFLRRHILSSTDYRVLSGADEARAMSASSGGWLASRTVRRQEQAYTRLIADMKSGKPRIDFQVAADAIDATGLSKPSLLEVGCGSGYYSAVFSSLLKDSVRYTGIDYSSAMIERAREHYPSTAFGVADATALPYPDDAFEIVFNGVSLMHIIDYEKVIRESARVASDYCVLHTVPVFPNSPTLFLTKLAYGAPVVEIIFDKSELLSLCDNAGLSLVREWQSLPYDVHDVTGHRSRTETYLFKNRKTRS